MVEIFERGRAKFVIMRIPALVENESATGCHESMRLGVLVFQKGKRLACGRDSILTYVSEDFSNGIRPYRFKIGFF